MEIFITKRDGTREPFDADRINRSIERACVGLPNIAGLVTQIGAETQLTLYNGITEQELDEATINAAIQNVKEDPVYDTVATRILLKTVYKRILGDFEAGVSKADLEKIHKDTFITFIKDGVTSGLFDKRMIKKFDLKKLADALVMSRDNLFLYAGLSTLLHRYSSKGKDGKSIETPQYFFMRVAMGLSYNEENPTKWAIKFYEKMSRHEYIPGGSTNIGAGTSRPALSNCFLLEMHDDIDHIAKSISDVIKISKATGGIGLSITKLRASGSPLSSNNTTSTGPAPFAKIVDTSIRAIARGGKKKGALCFYMENWHIDFPEYIDWKHNAGDDYLRMRTANTAVFISDEFMKRVKAGEDWYMFDPKETTDLNELYGAAFSKRYAEYIKKAENGDMRIFKKVPAQEQYRQILVSLQTTSHPWLTWKDTINDRALNNNRGTIHMSNLCTEICLPQDKDNIAVCNLASLNLSRHLIKDNTTNKWIMNWERLAESVSFVVRQLDNLIDINKLPIPEAIKSDKENRAIGMGTMGFADVVEKLGYAYDSDEAYDFADKVFEFVSYHAINESADLAKERGSYDHFKGSGWSKGMVPIDTLDSVEKSRGKKLSVKKGSRWSSREAHKPNWDKLRKKVKKGMRNSTLMAVAPNANIGLVAGTVPGIDARFSQVFSRNKISGKYLDINHNLVYDLKEIGLWEEVRNEILENHGHLKDIERIPDRLKRIYKSSFTTSPYGFMEVAARAQKWVDQALSRNIYLESRDIDEAMNLYTTAWDLGVKTTYYCHMKPRHTAEQSTVKVNKAQKLNKKGFAAVAKAVASTESNETMEAEAVETPEPVKTSTGFGSVAKEVAGTIVKEIEKERPVKVASRKSNVVIDMPIEDPQQGLVCDACQ